MRKHYVYLLTEDSDYLLTENDDYILIPIDLIDDDDQHGKSSNQVAGGTYNTNTRSFTRGLGTDDRAQDS